MMPSGEQDLREATKPDVTSLPCLMCGGRQHRPIFNEFGIDILRCRACHHVFSSFQANPHYDGFWGESIAESALWYWQEARSLMYQDFFQRFYQRVCPLFDVALKLRADCRCFGSQRLCLVVKSAPAEFGLNLSAELINLIQ